MFVSAGSYFIKKIRDRMARFRKLYVEDPNQHHDALEFSKWHGG